MLLLVPEILDTMRMAQGEEWSGFLDEEDALNLFMYLCPMGQSGPPTLVFRDADVFYAESFFHALIQLIAESDNRTWWIEAFRLSDVEADPEMSRMIRSTPNIS